MPEHVKEVFEEELVKLSYLDNHSAEFRCVEKGGDGFGKGLTHGLFQCDSELPGLVDQHALGPVE